MQNAKLLKQYHDNKTVNVQVYQITKIDTQKHTTDKNQGEDGSTALELSVTNVESF